jgi:rod shape determining protein RodA
MKNWKNFDPFLVVIPAIIVAFSCAMLYEISRWAVNVPTSDPFKQLGYALLGLILFWIFTNIDYRRLSTFVWPAYVVALASLVLVSVLGSGAYGATRWINLGFIQLQPSEPAKIVVVLALAKFFSEREGRVTFSAVLTSLALIAVPAILVLREPDFGSFMVFVVIWITAIVMASTPWRYMATLGVFALIAAPITWLKVLHTFQRARLTSFLHPDQDLRNTNYGPFHAQLAIGSGGPWGEWFSRTTQSRLNFLVFQDKDYIFSVIAEQIGFFGVLIIFALVAAFLFRVARVAYISADGFGRMIAGGVLVLFLFQTFINVGMNLGIMPVTGIPLPLLSYGGSSLITCLASLGILESVLLRHQKLVFNTGQSIL